MTIKDIADITGSSVLTLTNEQTGTVNSAITHEILSYVLNAAKPDSVWVTAQSHMNVIAVAVLKNISCIIFTDNVTVKEDMISKASEEGITLLSTAKSSFEASGLLYEHGLRA